LPFGLWERVVGGAADPALPNKNTHRSAFILRYPTPLTPNRRQILWNASIAKSPPTIEYANLVPSETVSDEQAEMGVLRWLTKIVRFETAGMVVSEKRRGGEREADTDIGAGGDPDSTSLVSVSSRMYLWILC
jgi:hypothetical protein